MSRELDFTARTAPELTARMLARVRELHPPWQPLSDADLGLTIIELLADRADRLAYEQDAVATEAYIGTARRRSSITRHARLLGERARESCNARTWVHVDVAAASTVPAGTTLLTAMEGVGGRIEPDIADSVRREHAPLVFETMHDLAADPALDAIPFHIGWAGSPMPSGATTAVLCGHHDLRAGDALCLDTPTRESTSPATVVRLDADPVHDVEDGHAVTRIRWALADRLRSSIDLTGDVGPDRCRSAAVVSANLVLADHGVTATAHRLTPIGTGRWALHGSDVVWSDPRIGSSAAEALVQDPTQTLPAIVIEDQSTDSRTQWHPARDLLGLHRFARRFVVEPVDEHRSHLRFPDGGGSSSPARSAHLVPTVRHAVGGDGNVPVGVIRHLVSGDGSIIAIRNIVAGTGGSRAETDDQLRRRVPHAWRRVDTCVTPDDFADHARRCEGVRHASARRIEGRTIEISLLTDDAIDVERVVAHAAERLEAVRVVGQQLHVRPAVRVPVVVDASIWIDPRADRHAVAAAADEVLNRDADDRAALGAPLFASSVISMLMAVDGVVAVDGVRLTPAEAVGAVTPEGDVRVTSWEYVSSTSGAIEVVEVPADAEVGRR